MSGGDSIPRDADGRALVGSSGHAMQWSEFERLGRGGDIDVRYSGQLWFVVLRFAGDVLLFRICELMAGVYS